MPFASNKFNPLYYTKVISLLLFLLVTACQHNESGPEPDLFGLAPGKPETNIEIPDNRTTLDIRVLIFGNSHVSGIHRILSELIAAGVPDASIEIHNAGGGFLDNEHSLKQRNQLLGTQTWSHIILQGQKYSQSGITSYPTVETEKWIEKAKHRNTMPILFPEHPQRGSTTEGERVHQLHKGIAAVQKACVAPVGLTWDYALALEPSLALHQADGNHAAAMGDLLTAYVLYETMTGQAAELLPYIEQFEASSSIQDMLKQVASQTIREHPPCPDLED